MTGVKVIIESAEEKREKAINEKVISNRRLCKQEDYRYDKLEDGFWDIETGSLHNKEAVDASIPREYWTLDESNNAEVESAEKEEHEKEEKAEKEGKSYKRKVGRPRKDKLISPSREIMRVERDLFVECAGFWPGMPRIISDWYMDRNGYHYMPGWRIFNHYRQPPELEGGISTEAGLWIDHVKKLWPADDEHEFFFKYCAHMLQKTSEKCNTAIILSGPQGIGKDAAIFPLKGALGEWNVKGIDPDQLFERFQPFKETVLLTIDEVRGSKDEMRPSTMYNILKAMITTPPDTMPMNEKFERIRYVKNVLRIIMTTNDKLALYIPEDDRRLHMMHSLLPANWHIKEKRPDYFNELFHWFEHGGTAHVAAYLKKFDLSQFNPKAPVPKTVGWALVTGSWGEPNDCVAEAIRAVEEKEWRIRKRIHELYCLASKTEFTFEEHPDEFPKEEILLGSEMLAVLRGQNLEELTGVLKSPRKIAHRMLKAGYEMIPHPTSCWNCYETDLVDPKKIHNVRSKYAFVLPHVLIEGRDAYMKKIKERGRILVERKADPELGLAMEDEISESSRNVFKLERGSKTH